MAGMWCPKLELQLHRCRSEGDARLLAFSTYLVIEKPN